MNKGLIGALLVALIAAAGWYWTQGRTTEEPVFAVAPHASQVLVGMRMAEVIVPKGLSAQDRQGEIYFNAVCASCHGTNAAGQDGVAPPLVHRIYEPGHHGDMAFSFWRRGTGRERIIGRSATCHGSLSA